MPVLPSGVTVPNEKPFFKLYFGCKPYVSLKLRMENRMMNKI